jgi:beta-xylosidase
MSENMKLPKDFKPLFDYPIRDVSICVGPDGLYYLTGTTGYPDWWAVTGDIQIWKSSDLKEWTPIITEPRKRTTVWNIDRNGTWQKVIKNRDGAPFRPLWAPEIHFMKDTFWITYCIPRLGNGLLKSTSGKAEGPYITALNDDQPISEEIDASLFQDDNGSVYYVYGDGKVGLLKEDMSGLAEDMKLLKPANYKHVGFEGAFLFKENGRYYLAAADFVDGDYHCYVASSDHIYGPYGDRYLAVPHGGHNIFFKDKSGQWWSTFFGNDKNSPFIERPGILKIEFDVDGRIRPVNVEKENSIIQDS